MIAIPIAALALLLGVIALVIALTRRGAGIGWPIGGTGVAIMALLIGGAQVLTIGAGASAVSSTANQLSQERKRLEMQWDPPDGFAKSDIAFSLRNARVEAIPLKSYDGSESRTDERYLIIPLNIDNNSSTRKLDVNDLQPDFTIGEDASVVDNAGNDYRGIGIPSMSDLGNGMSQEVTLMPGDSQTLYLFFEKPVPNAKTLELKLPAERFEGRGTVVLSTAAP